mmetsp:Transcript_20785/g.27037  ORF Transcript_20785/g.27037 Transcript_20785/m.27037 type:complete len:98 (+) Transcript_20785:383-676(+)
MSLEHSEELQLMLDYGANIDFVDEGGSSALIFAAWKGHEECVFCVRLLIDAGAEQNIVNKDGQTPLDIARARDHSDCVELLERSAKRCKTSSSSSSS